MINRDNAEVASPAGLDDYPELMTRGQVAEYLQVTVTTLGEWAGRGRGPRCIYLSERTPRYRREDVRGFIDNAG